KIESIEIINSQNNAVTKLVTTQIEDVQYKEIKRDFYNNKQEEFHTFQKGLFFNDSRLVKSFKVDVNNLGIKRVIYDSEISVIQNFISSGNARSFLGLSNTSSLLMVAILEIAKYSFDEDLFISLDKKYAVSLKNCIGEIFEIIEMFDLIFQNNINEKLFWLKESIINKTNNISKVIIGTEDSTLILFEEVKND
ncbi:hypothetical protein, partial [Mycoplasma marinum]